MARQEFRWSRKQRWLAPKRREAAIVRGRHRSRFAVRPLWQDLSDIGAGAAASGEIAFAQQQVVRGYSGVARHPVSGRQHARGWKAQTRLKTPVENCIAQLLVQ